MLTIISNVGLWMIGLAAILLWLISAYLIIELGREWRIIVLTIVLKVIGAFIFINAYLKY